MCIKLVVKKAAFAVLALCCSLFLTGCSATESAVDRIIGKYDTKLAATTLSDDQISSKIVGRWKVVGKHFDQSLGMDITSEVYEHKEDGSWASYATAASSEIEYYFTIQGKWTIINKQLIVTDAVQQTCSIDCATGQKQEYENMTIFDIVETINDLSDKALTTTKQGADEQRIYQLQSETESSMPEADKQVLVFE